MAVTVVATPDNGAPAHQAPSKEAAKAAALEKINGAAKPPTEQPQSNAKPETSATPATPAAAPTTPGTPAAAKPQGEAAELRAAIELERAVRSAEQSRNEAAQLRRELEQSRSDTAARQKDWRRALQDSGHTIESVVMDYVGGDGTAAKSQQQPAPTQADPEVAALRRELAELKSNLANGAQRFNRDQRLESLRGLVRGAGDEYSGLSALEAEDNFLNQIEKLEAQEGRAFGDVEVRAHLTEFEKQTRDGVKAQLKRLGGTPWAKAAMRELLEEVQAEVAATTTPAPPAAPARTDLMNGDAAPASRVVLPRSFSEAKAAAKAKAIAELERRRSGLA